jgi:hypothetical protein
VARDDDREEQARGRDGREGALAPRCCDLEEQWANERDYTTNVVRGAKAEAAFPEFIARHGRPIESP